MNLKNLVSVPADQREKELAFLTEQYLAKQRPRLKDRLLAKTILSLKQGFDGTEGKCCYCDEVSKIAIELTIHHIDGIINHNELSNLDLAHTPCNTREYIQRKKTRRIQISDQSDPLMRERKSVGALSGRSAVQTDYEEGEYVRWSSREGEKHEEMRYRWENWVHDLEKGPFRGIGGGMRRSLLAEMAVYGCAKDGAPFGSSQTYARYINEDIAAGIFEARKDGSVWMVRYLGPRKDPNSLR